MSLLNEQQEVSRVLETSKVVAVVGFHHDPAKPAHYVPEYLYRQGYKIYGINPALAARHAQVFGHPVLSSLSEITEPVDIVEIFRRSDKVSEHLADILAMKPWPKVVWMQQGIRNDGVAQQLSARGIDVIQDRCMLSDHRQFL